MKAAEMFPQDFDGIVAGAPAVNFNNLTSWRASFFGKTGSTTSPDFIPADLWSGLIHDEILRQCDTIDGVQDGIIENPTLCDFQPEVLICGRGSATDGCLSTAQVQVVREIFSPLYGSSGEVVFPAMQPGSEVLAAQKLYAGTPFPYSLVRDQYAVFLLCDAYSNDRIGFDTLSIIILLLTTSILEWLISLPLKLSILLTCRRIPRI